MGRAIVTSIVLVGSLLVIGVGYIVYRLSLATDTDEGSDLSVYGLATSCLYRCGDGDYSLGCQCNAECFDLSNCCSDYEEVCFTCDKRCSSPVQDGAPCQCDVECDTHLNCCEDYTDQCSVVTIVANITDDVIREISEKLYSRDDSNIAPGVSIDIQGVTNCSETDDVAPLPLFSNVSPKVLSWPTVRLFDALRDNYNKDVSEPEDNTAAEQAEVAAFLDAVLDTAIMKELDAFLTKHQILTSSLRKGLEQIWFTPYARNGLVLGSSGFEHVFVGELNKETVDGLHNWISFFREEQAGDINYLGLLHHIDLGVAGSVVTNRFAWNGRQKSIGGGYIGTSPEFDLAMMTLCFYVRPNSLCPVQTNGRQYKIQTYDFGGEQLIGSAYPVATWKES